MVDMQEMQNVLEPEPPKGYTEGTLLRKYDIPVSYLDFEHVEKCENPRELEKIYHVLVSGEEGHYSELIKRTEDKLRLLKPNSKFLRVDNPILKREYLNKEERLSLDSDMQEWLKDVNRSSKELESCRSSFSKKDVPAVRVSRKLNMDGNKKDKLERIKSTDYESWNKYDADTELLKMDLEDEKLKLGVKKKEKPKEKKVQFIEYATKAESSFEANLEREKGNEYFRAGDFKEALLHYSNSIKYYPMSLTYSNRALVYFKQNKYNECIDDCKSAIKLDAHNVKAYFRLATTYDALKNYECAYSFAEYALQLDPNNKHVQNFIQTLSKKIERKGPCETTRMKIIDVEPIRKKTILKKPELESGSVIAIPGPSSMQPPYFVKIASKDPQEIRKAEIEVEVMLHRKLICMPVIDQEPDDDYSDPILSASKCNESTPKIYPVRNKIHKQQKKLSDNEKLGIDKEEDANNNKNQQQNSKENQNSKNTEICKNQKNQIAEIPMENQELYNNQEIKIESIQIQQSCNINSESTNKSNGKIFTDNVGNKDKEILNGCNNFKDNEAIEAVSQNIFTLTIKDDKSKNGLLQLNGINGTKPNENGTSLQSQELKDQTNGNLENPELNLNILPNEDDKRAGGEPCVEVQSPDMAPLEELHLPFTFLRTWNSANRDSTHVQHAEILRQVDTSRLGDVIGNKLDSTMLTNILQSLYQHFAVASEIDKVYSALTSLATIPRINIMVMFMSQNDRRCVKNLVEFLAQHDKSLPDDVKNMYCPL